MNTPDRGTLRTRATNLARQQNTRDKLERVEAAMPNLAIRTRRTGVVAAASFLVATAGCARSESNDESPREPLIRDVERTYPTSSYSGMSTDGVALVIHRVPVQPRAVLDRCGRWCSGTKVG